jgi:hypothetical protein
LIEEGQADIIKILPTAYYVRLHAVQSFLAMWTPQVSLA